MTDEQRPPELIELPLEHKKQRWEDVEKGIDGASAETPRREAGQPRRLWPWVVLVAVLAVVAYWVFWPSAPKIEFDVEAVDFADQRVGESSEPRTIVLRNVGEKPLEVVTIGVAGSGAADFATRSEDCSGRPVEPESECRGEIVFAPFDPGTRQAELEVIANVRGGSATLALSGTGTAPLLGSIPEVLDFGSESVGATSPALDLDLTNKGTFALEVRSVAVAGKDSEFALVGNQCSRKRLEPSGTCRLRVVFSPRLLGRRSAELAVDSDSHGDPAPIQLVGVGSGPDLEIEPPGLDFSPQLVGTTSEVQALRLTNKGNEPFRVASLSVTDKVGIEIVEQNCSRRVIAPGDSCSSTFRFRPSREGRVETSLQIRESSGGLAPGVALAGTGVSPRLEVDVSRISFEGAVVGATGSPRAVRVRNPGTATLEIREVRLVGGDASSFVKGHDSCSSVELSPGGRGEVEVRLRPRSPGDLAASLSFSSNAPGGTPTVALSGKGLAPQLEFSRHRLDFVSVRQTESQDLRVEVRNTGEAPLEVGRVRFEGAAASDFGLAVDGCSRRTIGPGASCQLTVRFSPQRNGLRDGRLVIDSNAPGGSATLVLRGSGEDAPEPSIDYSPRAMDFGSQAVGRRSEVLTLVIRSSGAGRLEIDEIRVEGADAAEFRLIAGTCQGLPYLVPGGDCSVGVRFTPAVIGERNAALVIEHNAPEGESRIPLSGSGY